MPTANNGNDSIHISSLLMDIDAMSGADRRASADSEAMPAPSLHSANSSAVSFEMHSALAMEEMCAQIDDDGASVEEEDKNAAGRANEECDDGNVDGADGTGTVPAPSSPSRRSSVHPSVDGRRESDLSLDSILEDPSVPATRKFELRVIDRKVRSGSRMFQSLSAECFANTVSGKVFRSASMAYVRNSTVTADEEPAEKGNATFSASSPNANPFLSELTGASFVKLLNGRKQ